MIKMNTHSDIYTHTHIHRHTHTLTHAQPHTQAHTPKHTYTEKHTPHCSMANGLRVLVIREDFVVKILAH